MEGINEEQNDKIQETRDLLNELHIINSNLISIISNISEENVKKKKKLEKVKRMG